MGSSLFRKFAIRAVVTIFLLLVCAFGFVLAEQMRTDTEFNAVLSAYLSSEILHDAHDWGRGHGILVVLQREAQRPGNLRWWLYLFDKRLRFTESLPSTNCSFTVSNSLPMPLRVALQLPTGVSVSVVSRRQLEQAESSNEFQQGYIAVSRAGFNVNKTEAIFYIDHFCGLCGGGRYVLMRKVNGIWKVRNEHSTWVS